MKWASCALLAGQLIWAAGTAAADESLQQLIQTKENAWADAYNANDVDRVTAFYEADAVLIAPGENVATGHLAIGQVFEKYFPILRKVTLVTDEVRLLGTDYAVEIGHSSYETKADDGSWGPGSDNYQVIWHKGPDGWHYVTDMFNARPTGTPSPG